MRFDEDPQQYVSRVARRERHDQRLAASGNFMIDRSLSNHSGSIEREAELEDVDRVDRASRAGGRSFNSAGQRPHLELGARGEGPVGAVFAGVGDEDDWHDEQRARYDQTFVSRHQRTVTDCAGTRPVRQSGQRTTIVVSLTAAPCVSAAGIGARGVAGFRNLPMRRARLD